MKRCNIFYKNGFLFHHALTRDTFVERLLGFMFQERSVDKIFIFEDAFWIHSFFVFFKFNAIFLDKDFKILSHKINIPPFILLKPVFGAKYVIEYAGEPKKLKKDDKIIIDVLQ